MRRASRLWGMRLLVFTVLWAEQLLRAGLLPYLAIQKNRVWHWNIPLCTKPLSSHRVRKLRPEVFMKRRKKVFFFFFFSITRLWILSQGRQPSKELTGLDLRRLQFISQLRHRNITQKKSFRVQAMRGCELMKHLSCSKAVFQVGHWDALLLLCKPQVAQSSVVLTS